MFRGTRHLTLAACSALTVLAIAASCSSSSKSNASSTTQPAKKVTTPLSVGTTTVTFVDKSRPTAANGTAPARPSRTLVTTVFYPVQGGSPDRAGGPYPLIVFSHGFGGDVSEGEALDRYWAARGYVVAAPLFPLSNAKTPGGPDAGDYVNQPNDVRFVITSMLGESARANGTLAHLIDPSAVGIAGHSLGGITTLGLAVDSCCHDSRVKAAVVMSGDALTFPHGKFDYSKAPALLFVHGTADPLVAYESSVDAFNAAQGPKGLLSIPGGDHGAPVDGTGKAFASIARTTTDFFDAYLKHDGTAKAAISHDAVNGTTQVVFVPESGSKTTIPTTPTTVGLTRHATADTTTNLTNGQKVTVHWSNYTPGKSVNVVECSTLNTFDAAACDLKHASLLQPDPTGSGTATITIVEGAVGNGTCDASHPNCTIIVNDGGSFDASASVRLPITFAG